MGELKEKNNEIDRLTQKLADGRIEGLFANLQEVCGVTYLTALMSGTKPDSLRILGDKETVALLVGVYEDKANMLCVCGKGAVTKGAHAGKIVQKAAAIAGGKGGGRPDSAMAGVADNHKIDEAFSALPDLIRQVMEG